VRRIEKNAKRWSNLIHRSVSVRRLAHFVNRTLFFTLVDYVARYTVNSVQIPRIRVRIHVHLAMSERSNSHFPTADRGCRDRSDNSEKPCHLQRERETERDSARSALSCRSKSIIPGMVDEPCVYQARRSACLMISVYRPTFIAHERQMR